MAESVPQSKIQDEESGTLSRKFDKKRKRSDFTKSNELNGSPGHGKLETTYLSSKSSQNGKNKIHHQQSTHVPGHNPRLKQRSEHLLKTFRVQLPIWSHSQAIRSSLKSKDVLILVGETGSGKSTQVPQFLMEEAWCSGTIAITQPRRVAAISLARRVAEEVGTPLGNSSPASRVGYSVRFDNSVSPSTKIKFLTEGMLLKEMLHDPSLKSYSCIIVDEVHERSVNVDLILGFLRQLLTEKKKLRKNKPLKIIVMSATADVESLSQFFQEGYTPDLATSGSIDSQPVITKAASHVSICRIPGRLFPVEVTYLPEPTQDFIETALKTIFQIHYKHPLTGDILVFLTGQETVESLEALVNEYALSLPPEVPHILTLPLFAALPQASQQKVFLPAPYRTRKVILSTNIAETSVTVPGVRHVVDCGRVKVKQFRSLLGLESLLVKDISKSSAIQRMGRAGREAAGQCYRLYTKSDYEKLAENTIPEILRCDLTDAVLSMYARGITDVLEFPLLSPPTRSNMEKAILQLLVLKALTEKGEISAVGQKMAKLPLPPSIARVLIEASTFSQNVLLCVIDIAAALTVQNIFLPITTEEDRETAEETRKELFRRDGDHITLLATVRSYAAEMSDRKAWAKKYFVSHRNMQNVINARKQLFMQCKQMKLLDENATLGEEVDGGGNIEERNQQILKSMVTGFPTNIARMTPDGSYKSFNGNHTVAIHPSSVLFGRKLEAILFTEYVFTTKSYGRNVSAIQLDWIDDFWT